jgi:hypothetical protein
VCGARSLLTLAALAVTITAIDSQSASASASDWPRITRPINAASTGLTLMNRPKNRAGTRRSASRSQVIGTAEHSRPATAARPRAGGVTACAASAQAPTGT